MRERGGCEAGWKRELVERDEGARLDGWGTGMRKRKRVRAGCMREGVGLDGWGEWVERKRKLQG